MEGWIKLHRKITEKSFYKKDSEAVHLWIHILICANRSNREEILGGKKIICNPGQFTTGRKQLSKDTGINESKIERLLNKFEKIEQQIKQEKTNTNRLISVINWLEYQSSEQTTEQQLNNERTTTEQQLNTLQEVKKVISKESKKEAAISSAAARQKVFYNSLVPFLQEHPKERIKQFYEYWSELNKSQTKMRFEMEKTWEIPKRLTTWKNKENDFKKPFEKSVPKPKINTPAEWMD